MHSSPHPSTDIPDEALLAYGEWEPPAPEHLQAEILGFQVLELIGRGGMGAVYKGWQVSLERYVAIKILRPNVEDESGSYAQLFQREAKTLARFLHPGIIAVFDAGATLSGWLYIIMEYVEGTDVSQMIKGQGLLPQSDALAIAAHVLDALHYAHTHGVVHRDIKPANIMVNLEGQVKVTDFGLARHDSGGQPGLMLGTPDYVAPEALTLGMVVDHRADLYSVGIMLHNMLTGQVPRGHFFLPSQVVGTDPRLDLVIEKALREEREVRYQSAREMRQALEAVLTHPAAKGSAAVPGALPRKPVARRPAPAAKPSPAVKPVSRGSRRAGSGGKRLSGWLYTTPLFVATVAVIAVGGFPKPPSDALAKPGEVSVAQPFANSLGMKFVPIPGLSALFCIHDTRQSDYLQFAKDCGGAGTAGRDLRYEDLQVAESEECPAVTVSWGDACQFCEWLSRKEGVTYRLPTDAEWTVAVGLGDRESDTGGPADKSGQIKAVYPWGAEWPPPVGAGNFADESLKEAVTGRTQGIIKGYRDGFATTAPVMRFAPNAFGLYDMAGNVWQWCQDQYTPGPDNRVLRGGAWNIRDREHLLSSYRAVRDPATRADDAGFRVVLELGKAPK